MQGFTDPLHASIDVDNEHHELQWPARFATAPEVCMVRGLEAY